MKGYGSTDTAEQAAAIPFRRRVGGVEVCLIQRKGSRSWGVPKGFVDRGDTHEDAALNEAWEEAGLKGRIVGSALGVYEYEKRGSLLAVAVFLMEVVVQESTWLEQAYRDRQWMSIDEATECLADHPVQSLLGRAERRLGEMLDKAPTLD
jgi:8-oxo-dGTP pyrophosphatase MutT (NUDIX family)